MSTMEDYEQHNYFVNHQEKCRICLWQFQEDDAQIKITAAVVEKFYNLTQIELNRPEYFSNTICETCNNKLRSFASFRQESIKKQTLLIDHVNEMLGNVKETEQEQESFNAPKDDDFDSYITTEYLDYDVQEEEEQVQENDQMYLIVDNNKVQEEGHIEIKEEEEGMHKDDYTVVVLAETTQTQKQPKKYYKRALCGLCGNSYLKDQLQRHIDKVHKKVKRFFCDVCGYGCFLKCNLTTHMGKHIAKEYREQINCQRCDSTFTRMESLKNHMKIEHETPIMLQCFCGKEFNLKHKLTTHIKRTHNNIRNHACDFCEKRFFTPKDLKDHTLKFHSPGYVDEALYFCEICGKQYASSKTLKSHMKYHQDPEFRCSFESCGKAFTTSLLLRHHEKIHLGQRDYMCSMCPKSFFSANHLKRHIQVSHDKIRALCFVDGCRFSVGRKDYLRNHIKSHRELPEDVKNDYLARVRDMKM